MYVVLLKVIIINVISVLYVHILQHSNDIKTVIIWLTEIMIGSFRTICSLMPGIIPILIPHPHSYTFLLKAL